MDKSSTNMKKIFTFPGWTFQQRLSCAHAVVVVVESSNLVCSDLFLMTELRVRHSGTASCLTVRSCLGSCTLPCRTFKLSWAGSVSTTGDTPKSNDQTHHKSYRQHRPSIGATDSNRLLLNPRNPLIYSTSPHHSTVSPGTTNHWSVFHRQREPGFVKGKQRLILFIFAFYENS